MKILFLTRLTLFTLRSPFYFLSLSFFYMPFSFAFYRGFINRQGNLLPSIPPSLVHPFFLLPPTPRRSLAAREYGIEGRIITEKKKKKEKMNTNRTRGCVKFTTCCTNDDSRCVGFWNIYRDELFCLGGITRALWKMIRFTFWGKIVNCRLLIVVFEGYAPIFRKFYDVNSFFNPLEQRAMKRVSIKNLVKKSKIWNLM